MDSSGPAAERAVADSPLTGSLAAAVTAPRVNGAPGTTCLKTPMTVDVGTCDRNVGEKCAAMSPSLGGRAIASTTHMSWRCTDDSVGAGAADAAGATEAATVGTDVDAGAPGGVAGAEAHPWRWRTEKRERTRTGERARMTPA